MEGLCIEWLKCGLREPQLLLEGWEEDIMSGQVEDYCRALKYYKQKWLELNEPLSSYKKSEWSRWRLFGIPKSGVGDCSVQLFTRCHIEDEHKILKASSTWATKGKRQSQARRSCQYTLDSRGQPVIREIRKIFRAIIESLLFIFFSNSMEVRGGTMVQKLQKIDPHGKRKKPRISISSHLTEGFYEGRRWRFVQSLRLRRWRLWLAI